jgi:erythromycin esterase-like protein
MSPSTQTILDEAVVPLGSGSADREFLELVGGARLVLLGEATHGTHEFYSQRAHLTRLLIERRGFAGLAVEADWPDAYRVNRFVQGLGGDADATQALGGFERFPRWMWRNREVVGLVTWLRARNDRLSNRQRAGFYGIDLYSLHRSMAEVVAFLEREDPAAARRARQRYACFDHFSDPQDYGHAASVGLQPDCEQAVVAQLIELRQRAMETLAADGPAGGDELFGAERNARVALAAERYYRSMFAGRAESWNQRDQHMAETISSLLDHLQRTRPGQPAKLAIWAHNSHLGDARATEMAMHGELNLGQLLRMRHGREAVLIGFTTSSGSVAAASGWGEPVERKRVLPALPGSYESLFHRCAVRDFLLVMRDRDLPSLPTAQLERAIGVIYRPDTERASHYFHASLARQFDAICHCDETTAVQPLETTAHWQPGELPDTYPSSL